MWELLSNNWVWILVIGGMLVMHLGHRGGHGGHGGRGGPGGRARHRGCGGHQHSGRQHSDPLRESGQDAAATGRPTSSHDHGSH